MSSLGVHFALSTAQERELLAADDKDFAEAAEQDRGVIFTVDQ